VSRKGVGGDSRFKNIESVEGRQSLTGNWAEELGTGPKEKTKKLFLGSRTGKKEITAQGGKTP